jgi:hypothetical protein
MTLGLDAYGASSSDEHDHEHEQNEHSVRISWPVVQGAPKVDANAYALDDDGASIVPKVALTRVLGTSLCVVCVCDENDGDE